MSNPIIVGRVSEIKGVVMAENPTGSRILTVGQPIYANDTIYTGQDSFLTVLDSQKHFHNLGQCIRMDIDGKLMSDPSLALIQNSLRQGTDLSVVLAPTAAGPDAPSQAQTEQQSQAQPQSQAKAKKPVEAGEGQVAEGQSVEEFLEGLPATAAGGTAGGGAGGAGGDGGRELVWIEHMLPQGLVLGTYPTIGIARDVTGELHEVYVLPDDQPTAEPGEITHDETPGVDEDADDVDNVPDNIHMLISDVFEGSPPDICGYAQVQLIFAFGDNSGGKLILDPVSNGFDSGLTANIDGVETAILLFNEGDNVIVGKADDVPIFLLHLDSPEGAVYLTQFHQINHPDDTNPDDEVSIDFLTYTVMDNDGDMVSVPLIVNFQDDGPTVGEPEMLMVDEGGLDGSSDGIGNIMDMANTTVDFGKDGPGRLEFQASTLANLPELTSGGEAIEYSLEDDNTVLVATADGDTVFTIEFEIVDGLATGKYILKLFEPIDHLNDFDEVIQLNLDFTAFDSDEDPVDGSFLVKIKDDVPVAKDDMDMVVEGKGNKTMGNVITGVDPDSEVNMLQMDMESIDQPHVIMSIAHDGTTYMLSEDQQNIISDGNQNFEFDPDTGKLKFTTEQGGKFIIDMSGDNVGKYTYKAPASLVHEGCDVAIEEKFEYGLKDFDGDTSTAVLTIAVKDGEPQAGEMVMDLVKEAGLKGGSDSHSDSEIAKGIIFGFDPGPDKANLWISLDLLNIADKNDVDLEGMNPYVGDLTSMGQDITLDNSVSGLLIATREDGAEVFVLKLQKDGTYTFKLKEQLDHPEPGQYDENDIFELKFQYTLDDHDGCDPDDSARGMIIITIEDDKPKARDTNAGMLSENHEYDGVMDVVHGTLNFKSGADDPATVVDLFARKAKDTDDGGLIHPLTSGGHEVTFDKVENADSIWLKGTINVYDQVLKVVTVHVDKASGDYVIKLHRALDHPDQGESGVDDQITLRFGYTVEDFDGDQATSWLKVTVKDDKPVAKDDWDMVREGGMTRGNVITGYDPDGPLNRKELNQDWVGADKPGMIMNFKHNHVLYTLDPDSNTVSADKDVDFHYNQTTKVLTIETNLGGSMSIKLMGPDAGWYKYTAPESLEHDCIDDRPIPEFEVFRYGLKDFDGDIDYAILDIAIKDGEPKAGRPVLGTVQEKALDDVGTMPGLDSESVSGMIQGFDAGPDGENLWITINKINIADTNAGDPEGNNPYLGDLLSQGQSLVYSNPSNGVLEAHRDGDDALVFRLTIDKDGKYNFELFEQLDHPEMNQSGSNDIFDIKFAYVLDDHDGCDPDASARGMITITIEDDKPKARDTNAGMLTENHEHYGVMDSVMGMLNFKSGADDPAKVIDLDIRFVKDPENGNIIDPLTSGGHEVEFTKVEGDHGIWLKGFIDVYGDKIPVITVHVNKDTGKYEIDLHRALDHPDAGEAGADDPIKLSLKYTVQDFDGDKSSSWLNVTIKDDKPDARDDWDMVREGGMTRGNVITGYDPDGPLNRKELNQDWVGADKPGMIMNFQHNHVLYTLDPDTNTVTSSKEVPFDYDQANKVLTIETNLGGTMSIKLMGPDAGWYKYTAPEDVEHECQDDNPIPEFELFRYGLKDFDGDIDYAILDIAVKDGEPKAGRPVLGTVQEKALDDMGTMPGLDTESVSGMIQGFDAGNDPDNLWITINKVNIADTNAGDPEGNNPYQGTLLSQDQELVYSNPSNGVLEAHRDGDDALVFRLTIESDGKYNFELFEQLDHPEMNQSGSNDIFDIKFAYVLDDHDGCDPDASARGMITITIEDDKPKARDTNAGMLFEKHDYEGVMDSVMGMLNFKSGADDPAKVIDLDIRFAKDPENGNIIDPLTSGGHEVEFTKVEGDHGIWLKGFIDVYGDKVPVITVHVNKDTGKYEIDLHRALDHPDAGEAGADDPIRLSFKYTVQDFDGDKSTSWLKVTIKDDQPDARDDWDMVREGGMTRGNVITGYDPDGPLNRKELNQDWVGADKPGMIMNLQHNQVLYTFDPDTNTVSADKDVEFNYDQANKVLTIETNLGGSMSIKLMGPDAGWYKYTAPENLDHECQDDNPVPQYDIFRYGLKDFDGDIDYAILDIAVKDGEPKAGRPVLGTVQEKALDDVGTMPGLDTESVSGMIQGFDAGPDGENLWITINKVNIADTNAGDPEGNNPYLGDLLSQDQALVYSNPSNGVLEAHREGDDALVFRLTIDNDGKYNFELFEQLDHPEMNQSGSNDIFDIKFAYVLDDHDGCDPDASARGMITITIEDDKPKARDTNAGMLFEKHDYEGVMDSVMGMLNFKSGADDPAKVIDLDIRFVKDPENGNIIDPLTSGGHEVEFTKVEGDHGIWLKGFIDVYGDKIPVITVHVNKDTGKYEIDLHRALDHPDAGEAGADDPIKLSLKYTVQDFDGDKSSSWLNVTIKDDKPDARDDWDMVREGGMTRGNVITGYDPDDPLNRKELNQDWVGADKPGMIMNFKHNHVLYTLDPDTNTVSADKDVDFHYNQTTKVLTIETNLGGSMSIKLMGPDAGWYKYTAPDSVEHECQDDNPVPQFEVFRYGLKDFDGDIDYAILDIAVKDGEPKAGRPVLGTVQEKALDDVGTMPGLDTESVSGMIQGFDAGPDGENLWITINKVNIADTNAGDPEGNNPYQGTLLSQDQELVYSNPSNGVLEAHRDGDDALVFRLTIDNDGKYNFELFEQLDHPEMNQSGSNDIFDIKFAYVLDDHDGCDPDASARGMITITIEDDKPKARDTNAGMLFEKHDYDGVMDSVMGMLNFKSGADDPAKVIDLDIGFVKDPENGNIIDPLTSGGHEVEFTKVEGDHGIWLKGFIDVYGDKIPVITVHVNKDTGKYEIDLHRALDHPDAGEAGADDPIKLSLKYTVQDFDGDKSSSWLNVTIKDDKPDARDDWDMVREGGMTRGNVITGYDPDGPLNRKELNQDWVGADKPGMIMNFQHDQVLYTLDPDTNMVSADKDVEFNYDQATKVLTIETNLGGSMSIKLMGPDAGWYKYTAPDSVEHECHDDNPVPEFEIFRYGLKDFDGDIDYAILDIAVKDGEPTAGRPVIGTVKEKAINDDGTMPGSTAEMVMGTIHGFDPGPDGDPLWINLELIHITDKNAGDPEGMNPYGSELTSCGQKLIASQPENGVLEYHREGDDALVFRLTLDADGKYKFEIFEGIDHPEAGQAFSDDIFELKFKYTLDDHDGCDPKDSAMGLIKIIIEDDKPKIEDVCVKVQEDEVPPAPIDAMRIVEHNGLFAIDDNLKITVTAKFISDFAGFSNSFGIYFANALGAPLSGKIIWADSDAANNPDYAEMFAPDQIPSGATHLGFFLIPDGADLNAIADGDMVNFNQVDGDWTAFKGATELEGSGAPVYFSDPNINPDNLDHVINNELPGNFNWEDLFNLGDQDFNDLNVKISVSKMPYPCGYAEGLVPVEYGADNKLSLLLTGDFWIAGNAELTVDGEPVHIQLNQDGNMITGTSDGDLVFILKLDSQTNEFKFWQFDMFDDVNPEDDIEHIQIGFDVEATDKDHDSMIGKIQIKAKVETDQPPSGADIMVRAEDQFEDEAPTPIQQVIAGAGCAYADVKVTLVDAVNDVISKVILQGVPDDVSVQGWSYDAQENVWVYDNLANPLFISGQFVEVKFNLPEHWDKDLALKVSSEIQNVQSQQTVVVMDNEMLNITIDAVAAQPDVIEVVATEASGDGYIQAGEKVNLAIEVQFHDIQDNGMDGMGEEQQYVLFQVPEGWMLVNGDNIMIDQYVGFHAEPAQNPPAGDGWYQVNVTEYLDNQNLQDGDSIIVKPMVMAPDDLEGSKEFVFHVDNPPHNDNGGEIQNIWTSYNPETEEFTFTLKVSEDAEGFTLAINDGPNPKDHPGELALMYFDKNGGAGGTPVVTVYEYNGQNNANSYQNMDALIASSILNPELFNIAVTSLGGGMQELSFTLDGTVVSNYFENIAQNPDPDWTGIAFDELVGIWLHPFGDDLVTKYEDGKLTKWYGSQGWYDVTNQDAECVCDGIEFNAVAQAYDPAIDGEILTDNNFAQDAGQSEAICVFEPPAPQIDIEKLIRIEQMDDRCLCETLGKAAILTFAYTGLDDSVMNHEQDSNQTYAIGDPMMDPEVYIVAKSMKNAVYFDGIVNLNDDFIVDASAIGRNTFSSVVKFDIYDEEGGELLQQISYHTSCSQPMHLGDEIGAVRLVGYENQEGEIAQAVTMTYDADEAPGIEIEPNQDISFIYKVTNPGDTPLMDIMVIDDNGTPDDTGDDYMPTYISGDENQNNVLDAGEVWMYESEHQTVEGQYTNVAMAKGTDEYQQQATDEDAANYYNNDDGKHEVNVMNYEPEMKDYHGTDVEDVLRISDKGMDIDFTVLDDEDCTNIDKIDMRNGSDIDNNNTLTLNLNDVVCMTDSDNVLKITGDTFDTVNLINGDGNWQPIGDTVIGSLTFAQYEQSGVTVQIQQEVHVDLS